MENLGEFWWVVPVGAFVGAILLGYGRKPQASSAIQGAAIISSESAERLIAEVKRLAVALEHVASVLQHDSEEASRLRNADEMDRLRREIERLKRGKE